MKKVSATLLTGILLFGSCLMGCETNTKLNNSTNVNSNDTANISLEKAILFEELAYESQNIFVGTITKLGDKKLFFQNDSEEHANRISPYKKVFPVTVAVSEVLKGKTENKTEIVKEFPVWYANELEIGSQCLFMTDYYFETGMFFDILKIENGKIIPYVEEQKVSLHETDIAYSKLPKTIEEAKQVIHEMIALKEKHDEMKKHPPQYETPSDTIPGVIDPFRDPNG